MACILLYQSSSDIVKHFAERWGFNIWDWSAVLIALFSFLLAICSFWVALKTLRSQKQTQKNTTPIMSLSIQESLLMETIAYAYQTIIQMYALSVLLSRKKHKLIPEESVIQGFCLPIDYIHEELFYEDENKFGRIHYLKNSIEGYNRYIKSVSTHVYEYGLNAQKVERMYGMLNETCHDIIYTIQYLYDNELFNNSKFKYIKRRNKRVNLTITVSKGNQGRDYKVRQIVRRYYDAIFPYQKLKNFEFGSYIDQTELYSIADSISQFAFNDDNINDYFIWTNRLIEECIASNTIIFIDRPVKQRKKRDKNNKKE